MSEFYEEHFRRASLNFPSIIPVEFRDLLDTIQHMSDSEIRTLGRSRLNQLARIFIASHNTTDEMWDLSSPHIEGEFLLILT